MSGLKTWTRQVLIAGDQLLNALAFGWADETLSARCWRLRDRPGWGLLRRLIDMLFFWDRNHCRESYDSERLGRQNAPEYREERAK